MENKNIKVKHIETFTVELYALEGLPDNLRGVSMPADGHNVYRIGLNDNETEARKLATFLHEITHIYNHDHEKGGDVMKVEYMTRQQLLDSLVLLKHGLA